MNYLKLFLISFIVIIATSTAHSRNEYLGWWGEVYGNSQANQTACQLCHERTGGGNGWNRYGWSIRSALGVQSAAESVLKGALNDVENVSDGGDSFYISQITNDSQPGWLVSDQNRIRSVVLATNGQFETQEKFISANGVQPCGVLIDPPNLTGNETDQQQADELQRVQTCSTSNPISTAIEKEGPELELKTIATGFTAPVSAVAAPQQSDSLYVVEQGGVIWHVDLVTGQKREFLDFSNQLVSDYGQRFAGYDERGLLGFVFHPNYAANSKVYTYISTDFNSTNVDFTTLAIGETGDHMSEIAEWVVVDPLSENSQASMKKKLLAVAQPQFNHNGGMLEFGPQGYLFIALGDGGNSNDQGDGHGSNGNARDNTNALGSLLRIDVDANAPLNGRYEVPSSNPFVGKSGLDEIYVYGLRNPYRFSIEENNSGSGHELYIADVGQDAIEELNRISLNDIGSNFGWNYKEGSFYFSVIDGTTFVSATPALGVTTPLLVDPIAEYDHNEGISIIGGYVYQGNNIPELKGQYIFGDWGRSFANADGRLFFINTSSQLRELNLATPPNVHVTGFGRDTAGEIYFVGSKGFSVLDQAQGTLQKIVPANNELCLPIKTKTNSIALVCL